MKKNEEKLVKMGELSACGLPAMKNDYVALNMEVQVVVSCQLMAGTTVFSRTNTLSQMFIVKMGNGQIFLVGKELARQCIVPINQHFIRRLINAMRFRRQVYSCLLWLLVGLLFDYARFSSPFPVRRNVNPTRFVHRLLHRTPRIALRRRRHLPYRIQHQRPFVVSPNGTTLCP